MTLSKHVAYANQFLNIFENQSMMQKWASHVSIIFPIFIIQLFSYSMKFDPSYLLPNLALLGKLLLS